MLDQILKRPAISAAWAISVIIVAGFVILYVVTNTFATDFSVYWRAAGEPLSAVYAQRTELPFPYAPTMLLWVAPLALVPMWVAFAAWVAASVAIFVLVVRQHLSGGALYLALCSPPVMYGLFTGQVTVAIAALLLWACTTNKRIFAGVALAAIASIKPHLVLMAPLALLMARDWQALGAAAGAFLAIVAASLAAFGLEPWFNWLAAFENFHEILINNNVLIVAVTPAGVAEFNGLPPTPFIVLGALAGACLVFASKEAGPLRQSAAIAAGSLLAAPYALIYDLAAVVPFLAWATYRGSLIAAFSMSAALNPAPLIATALLAADRKRQPLEAA